MRGASPLQAHALGKTVPELFLLGRPVGTSALMHPDLLGLHSSLAKGVQAHLYLQNSLLNRLHLSSTDLPILLAQDAVSEGQRHRMVLIRARHSCPKTGTAFGQSANASSATKILKRARTLRTRSRPSAIQSFDPAPAH